MNAPAPLILTLAFDPEGFARFDALRRAHFPPERNLIPAHLTLFHQLPGSRLAQIAAELEALAAETPIMALRVAGLRFLGRGVAYRIECAALEALRRELARRWEPELTPQDKAGFRPHVTVQNKVDPRLAKALLAELEAGFVPWTLEGRGLLLWRYLGGPWAREAFLPFSEATSPGR